MMMCCGEIISSCVMAATLQKFGINAMALTGGQAGIITDSQFGAARIKNINTSSLIRLLEAGIIPVVCGFQGMTENNYKFTTLGRGGSDTSAAALGAALKADFVEIYTDVEGIMTATRVLSRRLIFCSRFPMLRFARWRRTVLRLFIRVPLKLPWAAIFPCMLNPPSAMLQHSDYQRTHRSG